MPSNSFRKSLKTKKSYTRRVTHFFEGRPLRFDDVEELPRIIGEAREHRAQIASAEVFRHHFSEDAAIVGRDGEVAPLVKLAIAHSRPARVNLSTLDIAAHQQHAIRVA